MQFSFSIIAQSQALTKQEAREDWLRKVLSAQQHIRKNGPKKVQDLELITLAELEEIRRIWVIEKHELEDSLPEVYQSATGHPYPGGRLDDNLVIGIAEMNLLRDLCEGDELHFQLTRELLSVEKQHKSMLRRVGLFKAIEKAFIRNFYDNEEDAVSRARQNRDALDTAQEQTFNNVSTMVQEIPDLLKAMEPTRDSG